jgi:hypothetical protein
MDRYWDLTEKQRAALTEEQLESLFTVERMEKGVLKPIEPKYAPEGPVQLPTERLYSVEPKRGGYGHTFGVLLATAEDAQKFIDLKPRLRRSDWLGNETTESVQVPDSYTIAPVDVPTEDAVISAKPELTRRGENAKRNKDLREKYEKEMRAFTNAVDSVREDYYRCCDLGSEFKRIVETFDNYVRTANGAEYIAAKFLAKAFPENQIRDAFAWHELPLPSDMPPATCAAEPEPVAVVAP